MAPESSASEPFERFGISFVCGEQPDLDGFADISERGSQAIGGENGGRLLISLSVFSQPRNFLSHRAIVLGFDNSCYIGIAYVVPDSIYSNRALNMNVNRPRSFSYRQAALGLYLHLCVGEFTEIDGGFRYVDILDWPELWSVPFDPPMTEACRNDLEETFLNGIHLRLPDSNTGIFTGISIYPSGLLVVGGRELVYGDVELVEE